MDHWERRLQLTARTIAPTGAPGEPARPRRDDEDPVPLVPPANGDIADLIHPDESHVVRSLLDLAATRPGFRAELSLLARSGDQWEYHRFEILDEVMGPVLRPLGPPAISLGDGPARAVTATRRTAGDAGRARQAVLDHLAKVLSHAAEGKVGVLLVDLDRFKLLNDLLGAEDGNELLRIMATRVEEAARAAYTSAIGGDEYVVIVDDVDDDSEIVALAEAIRSAISEPVAIAGERLTLTATVGLAIGGEGTVPDHLLRDADTALFAGKDHGRDRVEVFGSKLEARTARQLSTAHRLRQALRAGTLELHYQPVHSLQTGQVVAAEALMRIDHGPDEPLSPGALIDAAEDSGLIARLGRYILEETTSQLAVWEERLNTDRHFRVSVNISPIQLSNRDFSDAMRHALAATRVPPVRLSLEITGSVLLGLSSAVDTVVRELHELGIAFGLDDFGTDASSLGGLRRFPIRFIKIDRELVSAVDQDHRAAAIVESTVSLAHRLGISTIAVGVERTSQRDLLRSLGCDAAQGYLYSAPLDARGFADLF